MQADSSRPWIIALAVVGFVTVAGGAFAAHALENSLDVEGLARWQTGARYLGLSTVPLLAVAWRLQGDPASGLLRWSGRCTLVGALVFAASLWILSLTGLRWLGAITPLGGLGMLTGWALLGVHAARGPATRRDAPGRGRSSG